MTEITVAPAPEPPAPLVEALAAAKPGAVSALLRSAYERVQKPIAQRRLKSDLSTLVSLARDHETNGLPAGHQHYKLLYELACKKADAYGELRGVDSDQLRAELAALEVLKRLANPGAQRARVGLIAGVALLVLVPVALGVSCGMVSVGYQMILHLFGAR